MNKIIDFIIDSINAGRERLKMSIVTFYISLLALYHWRVFVILFFGGIPMMKKIEEIDALYKDYTPWFYLLNSLSILLVSIAFMILFPTIMWLSEKALVYVSIKRKEKKEEEDAADRNKDIEIVRHQFKLKQEETGNLKEIGYVDEIKKLRELVHDNLQEKMELEKELNNEREKQKHAITNLKSGFENVELNYVEQINELKRQLTVVQDNNITNKDVLNAGHQITETEYNDIHHINFLYNKLANIEKSLIDRILFNFKTPTSLVTLPIIDRSTSFKEILRLLNKLNLIETTKNSDKIIIKTNIAGLNKIIL